MSETGHLFSDFAHKMTRGDELQIDLEVTTITGSGEAAQDISTGLIRVIGKKSLADADAAAVFDLDNGDRGGVEIVSGPDGTALATIAPEKTAGLSTQNWSLYVRCIYVDAASKPHTFRTGRLAVLPG